MLPNLNFRTLPIFVVGLLLIHMSGVLLLAQQKEHPAMTLCKTGKHREARGALEIAVKSPEYKNDGEMWNCLGLAFYQGDDDKGARKAFEKAIDIQPANAVFRVNLAHVLLMNRKIDPAQSQLKKALEIDPKNPEALYLQSLSDSWEGKIDRAIATADTLIGFHPADGRGYILKADLLVSRIGLSSDSKDGTLDEAESLTKAVDVLVEGREKVTDPSGTKAIVDDLENKTIFRDYFTRERPTAITTTATPAAAEPGVTKLKVIAKQPARYTDRARQANVQGTIRIAVLFGSNGRILHTLLLKRLGYGLDEQALSAARQIKFEPQTKDGKPISVVRIVEYTFNIY